MRRLGSTLRILLHDDPSSKTLNLREIEGSILSYIPSVKVERRGEFFTSHIREPKIHELALRLGKARVRSLYQPAESEPGYGEIEYEQRALRDPSIRRLGIMYDGFVLKSICQDLLDEAERSLSCIHIIFNPRLLGTLDPADRRYHARVIVCGLPSLISTSGVVEGPAKPREFYMIPRVFSDSSSQMIAREKLKEKYRGRFLDYDDARLTEVMKGYVMQAFFYQVLGEAFCESKDCRLFNAHWQEDMIAAQLSKPNFCGKHQEQLLNLQGVLSAREDRST